MVSSSPLVSIHIITYNQIDFIHETLTSALEQDYENLEVIVADDGSTDGTADVICEYAEKYPNRLVPIVGEKNLGITGNSNRGLKACRGEYIAFQGGDDVLLPGKISAQVAWMEEDKRRVLCGHQVEAFYDDGTPSHGLTSFFCLGHGPKVFLEYGNCPYASVSIMVRADVMPTDGFDERLPSVSDYLCWVECLGEAGEYGYIEGTYARYRRHDGNITNNLDLCLVDLMKTYDILQEKYPHYASVVQATKWYVKQVNRANTLRGKKNYISWFLKLTHIALLSPKRFFRAALSKMKLGIK